MSNLWDDRPFSDDPGVDEWVREQRAGMTREHRAMHDVAVGRRVLLVIGPLDRAMYELGSLLDCCCTGRPMWQLVTERGDPMLRLGLPAMPVLSLDDGRYARLVEELAAQPEAFVFVTVEHAQDGLGAIPGYRRPDGP